MKIKNDLYASDILRAIVAIAIFVAAMYGMRECSRALAQSHYEEKYKYEYKKYLTDSLKAHILFEDNCGKIILIQNEDL